MLNTKIKTLRTIGSDSNLQHLAEKSLKIRLLRNEEGKEMKETDLRRLLRFVIFELIFEMFPFPILT